MQGYTPTKSYSAAFQIFLWILNCLKVKQPLDKKKKGWIGAGAVIQWVKLKCLPWAFIEMPVWTSYLIQLPADASRETVEVPSPWALVTQVELQDRLPGSRLWPGQFHFIVNVWRMNQWMEDDPSSLSSSSSYSFCNSVVKSCLWENVLIILKVYTAK